MRLPDTVPVSDAWAPLGRRRILLTMPGACPSIPFVRTVLRERAAQSFFV